MKKVLNRMAVLLILLSQLTMPLHAEATVSEVLEDLNEVQADQKQVKQDLKKTQEQYEDLVNESRKIDEEINKVSDELNDTKDKIKDTKEALPKIEKQAMNTLLMLQRNQNVNYFIQLLFADNGASTPGEAIRMTMAANRITGAAYENIDRLIVAREELEEEEAKLASLKDELNVKKNEADKNQKKLLVLIQEQEEINKEAAKKVASKSEQMKFLKDAGCKGDDVYGVDCGVILEPIKLEPVKEAKVDTDEADEIKVKDKLDEEETVADIKETQEDKEELKEDVIEVAEEVVEDEKTEKNTDNSSSNAESKSENKSTSTASNKTTNNTISNDTDTDDEKEETVGFRRPVKDGVVTNEFGGYDGYGTGHKGIDIANRTGTPIYSVAQGVVIEAGTDINRGKYVSVIHNVEGKNYVSTYWHMNTILVTRGQVVTSNTPVGTMGSTGIATGPHLHFGMKANSSVYVNETAQNPRQFISFPSLGTWFHSR